MKSIKPKETMYGSLNRLQWFEKFLTKDQKIVDLGCGTGYMITIPLLSQSYNVIGVDLDEKSIEYGKKILKKYNINEDCLVCKDFKDIEFQPDIVILSQVLEHLTSDQIHNLVSLICTKLKPGGHLLVTIPNGYGCAEIESFLWYKARIGKILKKLYIAEAIIILKNKLVGNTIEIHPSSLDGSPHIQRFTYSSIERLLKHHGFAIKEKRGGCLMSGPLSNLLFTGIKPIMKLNIMLGSLIPWCAADFYIAVQKPVN